MSGTEKGSGTTKTPADFLKSIRGRPVVVKLNSGVDYRGQISIIFIFVGLDFMDFELKYWITFLGYIYLVDSFHLCTIFGYRMFSYLNCFKFDCMKWNDFELSYLKLFQIWFNEMEKWINRDGILFTFRLIWSCKMNSVDGDMRTKILIGSIDAGIMYSIVKHEFTHTLFNRNCPNLKNPIYNFVDFKFR